MTRFGRTLGTLLLSTLAVLSIMPVSSVHAAAQGSGQALEIAPPVLNVKADPGETITTSIKLRDVSTSPLVVRNQINDFVAAGEDGTPKLLLEDSDQKSPYSLKDWIQPLPQFTLKPRQVNDLKVSISVPANAAPGGYYAVVRFTASPPGLEGSGVSLSASLGTLILLRVNGDIKEDVAIESFTASKNGETNWLFESPPIEFIERLRNNGSSHEQPTGQVVVSDMFGNKIGAVNVNLNGNNVLPGSIRKFNQTLDSSVIGDRVLFGRYTADLKMTYGTDGQTLTASTSFWVIPYRLIAFAIVLLIIAFVLIRIGLRRYNERVIARSSRSRRRRR
ncbi:MAG TPA: hypothetical protein PK096_00175 [Candidatus Saccharibacteria bacterium]|nr:hypothetical protein [Candidatus Saccharibacteria bacterium]HRK93771.1 hypothetical protein [Candidatus Saccharibacteria bacterium]